MPISVRQATREDVDSYLKLQNQRWDDDNQASQEQLLSRLKIFPQGMLVAEEQGEIVGMVYAMKITSYDESRSPSWYEITHDGMCDNHDPNGKVIFGVDLSTKPGVGARAGDQLLVGVARLAIKENVAECMLGGRMPGYAEYADRMSAEEYLWAKNDEGKFLDRQVRFYAGVPGLRVIKSLPEYFNDPPSKNYGVLLRWHNPFFGLPFPNIWSALFPVLFKIEELYIAIHKKINRR